MSFRLITLLYLFALVAASLAVFGAWGLAVAGILGWHLLHRRRAEAYYVLLALGLFGLAWVGAAVGPAREAARANTCQGHLKQMIVALLNYHDVNKQLPPTGAVAGKSQLRHSWRVLLLPFLEYRIAYNFNQPWDGPTNSNLPNPRSYLCPTHGREGFSNYFAITGPQTVWGDGPTRTWNDIADGREQTIVLIEAAGLDIDWKEPRDLPFDEAVEVLTAPVDPETFGGHFDQQAGVLLKPLHFHLVAMADGSIRKLRAPVSREMATALLTASGGEPIDLDELGRLGQPTWNYGRIYGFALFAMTSLAPAVPAVGRRILPRGN